MSKKDSKTLGFWKDNVFYVDYFCKRENNENKSSREEHDNSIPSDSEPDNPDDIII
jgi:hypothetical protein